MQTKDNTEQADRHTRAAIRHNMELYNISAQDIADKTGVTKKTVNAKIADPRLFTMSDIRRWSEILHFTDRELVEFTGRAVN